MQMPSKPGSERWVKIKLYDQENGKEGPFDALTGFITPKCIQS